MQLPTQQSESRVQLTPGAEAVGMHAQEPPSQTPEQQSESAPPHALPAAPHMQPNHPESTPHRPEQQSESVAHFTRLRAPKQAHTPASAAGGTQHRATLAGGAASPGASQHAKTGVSTPTAAQRVPASHAGQEPF
jgi:hypothetical protein